MDVIIVIGGALLLMYMSTPKRESGEGGTNVSINDSKGDDNSLFSWFF